MPHNIPHPLHTINHPAHLRQVPRAQLRDVADELRAYLLDSVSKTGGHLSSNLGTVELTVALHYVFDTPHDRVVWDVGHQTYPHKILTGRRDRMPTLRQLGGLSARGRSVVLRLRLPAMRIPRTSLYLARAAISSFPRRDFNAFDRCLFADAASLKKRDVVRWSLAGSLLPDSQAR